MTLQDAATTQEGPALLEALSNFAWPALTAFVLWRIFPALRRVVESRAFSVKVGDMEVTVQEASDKLRLQVDDLQQKVSELRARTGEQAHPASVPEPSRRSLERDLAGTQTAVPSRRVLWVDDQPSNNAYEVARLKEKGIDVTQVRSTNEALNAVSAGRLRYGVVLSDMGRHEDGQHRGKAGISLIEALRANGADMPAFIYTSVDGAKRHRDAVIQAGGNGITASPVELFEMIHSVIPPAS